MEGGSVNGMMSMGRYLVNTVSYCIQLNNKKEWKVSVNGMMSMGKCICRIQWKEMKKRVEVEGGVST